MRHLGWRFYNHICEISGMETKCRQIAASLPLGLILTLRYSYRPKFLVKSFVNEIFLECATRNLNHMEAISRAEFKI